MTQIGSCRIGGGSNLVPVLDLGRQALTGVFPRSRDEAVPVEPLQLVFCPESKLLQLAHNMPQEEMFSTNYGYRSGLNAAMVQHLDGIVRVLSRLVELRPGDTVLDIGSNDGTLLGRYSAPGLVRIGIDPTSEKFRRYYEGDIIVCPEFFSADAFHRAAGGRVARVVTSIAMFYDLEDPVRFARQVGSILAKEGVWCFEQSYLPAMLRQKAYDTVCHEHLEYYSLTSVQHLLGHADMKMLDVSFNDANGGSFRVFAARRDSPRAPNSHVIDWILRQEHRASLHLADPYLSFAKRVAEHRVALRDLVDTLRRSGKRVFGYGASTKGNVVIQHCGFGPEDITAIADVNPDKFGSYTPGSLIPIAAESEVHEAKPDYMIVFPWHFRSGILQRERDYLERGGHLIFPLPEIEIV